MVFLNKFNFKNQLEFYEKDVKITFEMPKQSNYKFVNYKSETIENDKAVFFIVRTLLNRQKVAENPISFWNKAKGMIVRQFRRNMASLSKAQADIDKTGELNAEMIKLRDFEDVETLLQACGYAAAWVGSFDVKDIAIIKTKAQTALLMGINQANKEFDDKVKKIQEHIEKTEAKKGGV